MIKKEDLEDLVNAIIEGSTFSLSIKGERINGTIRYNISGVNESFTEGEMRDFMITILEGRQERMKLSKTEFLLRDKRPIVDIVHCLEVEYGYNGGDYIIPGVVGGWTKEELSLYVEKKHLAGWKTLAKATRQT